VEAFLREILRVYRKKVLFTRHALNQMNLAERMILRKEVCEAIESDKVVEDYLAVVTVYSPSLLEWEPDFKTRRKG